MRALTLSLLQERRVWWEVDQSDDAWRTRWIDCLMQSLDAALHCTYKLTGIAIDVEIFLQHAC